MERGGEREVGIERGIWMGGRDEELISMVHSRFVDCMCMHNMQQEIKYPHEK